MSGQLQKKFFLSSYEHSKCVKCNQPATMVDYRESVYLSFNEHMLDKEYANCTSESSEGVSKNRQKKKSANFETIILLQSNNLNKAKTFQ